MFGNWKKRYCEDWIWLGGSFNSGSGKKAGLKEEFEHLKCNYRYIIIIDKCIIVSTVSKLICDYCKNDDSGIHLDYLHPLITFSYMYTSFSYVKTI